VKRPVVVQRLALSAMTVVTVWSLWASAHPSPKPSAANRAVAGERSATPADAKGAEDEGLLPMNWVDFSDPKTPPFIAMLINFGVLAGGFYYFGRAPVAAALRERRDSIAKGIEDAQRMKREAEARAKDYEAKLASLEEDVRAAREALVRVGEAERDRILAEVDAKAERMRKGAEFLVEQEMKQLRQDLWRSAVEAAVSSAETMLRQSVGPADQERLAEEYLRELGSETATMQRTGQPS
jgi:F-type H+-transporting ATPase subunit b